MNTSADKLQIMERDTKRKRLRNTSTNKYPYLDRLHKLIINLICFLFFIYNIYACG